MTHHGSPPQKEIRATSGSPHHGLLASQSEENKTNAAPFDCISTLYQHMYISIIIYQDVVGWSIFVPTRILNICEELLVTLIVGTADLNT